LVLGLLAPPVVVGYFAAAERLMKAAQNLFSPITQAVYPHLAQLFDSARNDALGLLGRLLLLVLSLYGFVAISCQVAPAALLHLVLGQRFEPAAAILRILAFYPLLIGINIISGALYLVPLNRGRALSLSVAIPTVFHVLMLYPLARFAGAQGVALLLLITEIMILAMRIHFTSRDAPTDLFKIWHGLTHPLQPIHNPS
jgi:PST family polysaccharide transporter